MERILKKFCKGGDEQNHFDRLPDELILSHILGKIPEAKTLLIYYSLCKRFSILVFQSTTIFLYSSSTAAADQPPQSMPRKLLNYLQKLNPIRLLSGQESRPFFSSSTADDDGQLIKILRKFRSLKILNVEIENPSRDGPRFPERDVCKWKTELMPQDSRNLIAFHAYSITDLGSAGWDKEVEENAQHLAGISLQQLEELWRIFKRIKEHVKMGVGLFEQLSLSFTNDLRRIVITDSWKRGKIVLGEARLADADADADDEDQDQLLKSVKFWHEKVVRLPVSGCFMKGVIIFAVQWGDFDGEDVKSIARGTFRGEDDQLFAEAVYEMLKKPAGLLPRIDS